MKRLMLMYLFCALLTLPAFTQESGLQPLANSTMTPPIIKLKDMGQGWMRVKIKMQGDSAASKSEPTNPLSALFGLSGGGGMSSEDSGSLAALAFLPAIMSALGMITGDDAAPTPNYYSKGQTITLGSETFMVVYRQQQPEFDLMKLFMESEKTGQEPDFKQLAEQSKLTEDSEMSLSLINVRAIASLKDIRPFELEREIAESASRYTMWDLFAMNEAGKEQSGMEGEEGDIATEAVPEAELSTSVLASMVNAAIRGDEKLSAKGNHIRAEAGENSMILRGTVINSNIKARATNIARQTLQDFDSNLRIENQLSVKSGSKK
jgi:hypothetical protein